jgi:phospholipase/carboxylesterase
VTKKRIVAGVVVVAVFCLVAQGVGSAATSAQVEQRALDAMAAGQYLKAADLWLKLLESSPGQARFLYNLACCHSRTGELERAGARLEEAYAAGMRDIELLQSDPDLEALRDSAKGRKLIERLASDEEKLRRIRGVPSYFQAPVLGGLRVVVPLNMKEDRAYPLVMILHGHGANPENYVGIFERFANSLDAIVCAPYGPYPIALERGHGYSWYPPPWFFQELLRTDTSGGDRSRRRREIERQEQEVSRDFVLTAIDHVSNEYLVDPERVFLMGHSEGGVLAYGLALEHPDLFRGLIVVGSRLRASDSTPEILTAAKGRIEVMICHSREDAAIGFDHATAAAKTLKEAGIQSKVFPYEGGHGLSVELVRTIGRWIAVRSGD